MRVLIEGGGVAGLTLAGLLQRQGKSPVVVERAADYSQTGYMLGLYPMAGRVLQALGCFDEYLAMSQSTTFYRLWNSRGRHVADFSFDSLTQEFGPYCMLSRGALLNLLARSCEGVDLRMNTTIECFAQGDDEVTVRTSDGCEEAYDVVIGADGMYSWMRDELFGAVSPRTTQWGGWIWWTDAYAGSRETVHEYWMRGAFLGIYPTQDRAGVFLGGPNAVIQQADQGTLEQFAQKHFANADGPAAALARHVPDESERFHWDLLDVRAPGWVRNRVALLGDSAAGFLPTAGIGASMAMESAAALADELARTNAEFAPQALGLYEKRRRARVEKAQQNSRQLARLMFTSSSVLARARDVLMRFYTMDQALKPIREIMSEPI